MTPAESERIQAAMQVLERAEAHEEPRAAIDSIRYARLILSGLPRLDFAPLPQHNRIGDLARHILNTGDLEAAESLTAWERCYVALTTDRLDLLPLGYTVVDAINALPDDWLADLRERFRLG